MPQLSICLPFYRNSQMLAHQYGVWAGYPSALRVEIVLVDDGSPEPAASVPRPVGLPPLRIFRVAEDRPWRQHGARNIAAHHAEAPWLLMTDMDHVVPMESLATLLEHLDSARSGDVFMFRRLDAPDLRPKLKNGVEHPHTNTYAVAKTKYWALGGYDEDCAGYGTDAFFLRQLKAAGVTLLSDAPIIRYSRDVIPDASTRDADRVADRQKARNQKMLERKARAGVGPHTFALPYAQAWP